MLPNLGRLKLSHAAKASRDEDGDEAGVPDLAAHEPPLSAGDSPFLPPAKRGRRPPPPLVYPAPAAPAAHAPLPEEDDLSTDKGYKQVRERPKLGQADSALFAQMLQGWPVDQLRTIDEANLPIMDDALALDEPPHRHLFSCLGQDAPIHHVRLNSESILATNTGAVQMNAFAALLALRNEFANKSAEWNHSNGCGSANCFRSGVDIHGAALWQVALRAIVLAVNQGADKREGGLALPKTVAVRAPKAVKSAQKETNEATLFYSENTEDARNELGLTLRAAHMGIAPPVYATFPVKVVFERSGTLASREYGYICEDGWTDLFTVLNTLPVVHPDSSDRMNAERSIAEGVSALMRNVARVAEYLMLDTKTLNMVARRAADTPTYEVLAIDFGAATTTNTKQHGDTHRMEPACIFFVNSLLLLNFVMNFHPDQTTIFHDLAMEVVQSWKDMQRGDDSFCALLAEDARRVAGRRGFLLGESSESPERGAFQARLRMNFYSMLEFYEVERGAGLLSEVDKSAQQELGFIDKYVALLEKKFERPRS